MENASKALLIAAGVLLGLMILSLAVFLFMNFGGTSAQIHDSVEQDQINNFNSQFTQYEGKTDVTIYDAVSLANLATQNNQEYELTKRNSVTDGKDNYISVVLDGTCIEGGANSNTQDLANANNNRIKQQVDNYLKNNVNMPLYNVKVSLSTETGRVYQVIFTKK